MSYQTTQKQAIFDWVRNSESHPTAQEVFEEVKKDLPQISFATVYRNLNALAKDGLIKEVQFVDNVKRYEGRTEPHQHFICKDCDRIIDMQLSELLNVSDIADQLKCHEVNEFRLELVGTCASCK